VSQSATMDALRFARDAWNSERPDIAWRVIDEVQPDFEYVRCSARRRLIPRFWLDTGPDEDDHDDWEPLPLDEQIAAHRAEVRAIDWLAWRSGGPMVNLASFDAMLKEMYSPDLISSFVFESRVRSYANLLKHQPGTGGPFSIDD